MARILVVEDEPNMQIGLKDNLEFEQFEVTIAKDGQDGLDVILRESFDLIILDVMMPKMSGFDVCKAARNKGISTPIIFLTAKGEEIDKVLGLELGADDYITKPFSIRELVARVKAILRRVDSMDKATATPQDSGPLTLGYLTVDFTHYTAIHENDGEVKPTAEIPVGEKEKLTVEEIMTPMQAILHELDEWYDALEEVKETGKIIE